MEEKNDLMHLKTEVGAASRRDADVQPPRDAPLPLLGLFAVGFAVLGIFTFAPIFVPLGLVLGIIALFIGQIGFGIAAIFLSIIGILTSPTILTVVGLGAFFAWLGL